MGWSPLPGMHQQQLLAAAARAAGHPLLLPASALPVQGRYLVLFQQLQWQSSGRARMQLQVLLKGVALAAVGLG